MNECQPINYKTTSLPGNARMKHQMSFNGSSMKPPLPPPPSFVRSNTFSMTTSDTTIRNEDQKTVKQTSIEVDNNKCDSLQHQTVTVDSILIVDNNKTSPPASIAPIEIDSSTPMPISPTEKDTNPNTAPITRPSEDTKTRPPPPNGKPPSGPSRTPSPATSTSPIERDSPMPISPNEKDPESIPLTSADNPKSSIDKHHSRPPPPNMKPPSRPSRPFPPPPQARLLEAKLSKKKPPPPKPVTVIDTRSTKTTNDNNTTVVTDSTKDLKELRVECSNFSSIPRRPPPPFDTPKKTSVVKFAVDEKSDKDCHSPPVSPTRTSTCSLKSTEGLESQNKQSVNTPIEEKEEEMDDVGPIQSSSPRDGKKFVSKMKSSFRSLTQRRKRKGDETGSPSSQRIASERGRNRRRNYDQERYPDQIPVGILNPLVIQCIGYLNQQECLNEPGLFRIPGDMSVMKQYRASFARGEEVNLSECRDPHTIAGLLKLHFREQRQCIVPGDALVHKIAMVVEARDVQQFKTLIESVDVQSQAGIRMLAELLKKITDNSDNNLMTSGTLATSCGPSFFPRIPPSSANAVLKFMTDNCDLIFGT